MPKYLLLPYFIILPAKYVGCVVWVLLPKQFNKSGSFFFIKYCAVPTNIVLTFVNANFTSDNIYFCNILKIFSTVIVIVTTRFIAL